MMERQAHIFDHSTNRRRLVRGLILICGLLLGLDWVLQRHTDHPWEALFGFYALYGFFACVALVLLARELLALTSAVLVFARRTDRALAAGIRYLAMMVVSGVLLLAGALLFERGTGGLAFGNIGLDASGGWLIFLAFGIKIPFFAFLAHDSRYLAEAHEPPRNMLLAMAIAAALCVGIGSLPAFFYGFLPFETGYMPYEAGHVLAQLQLLAFSALAFTWLRLSGLYPPELRSVNLDAEWLYRRLMPELAHRIMRLVAPINRKARLRARVLAKCSLKALAWHHGSRGVLARSASIGNMVLWVVALLGLSLLLHYL